MSQFKYSLLSLALCLPLISHAAQTCQPTSITATTPTTQFTVHGDGTVTDKKTGLMWKQCPEGQSGAACATGTAVTYTWQGALQQAASVNGSGFATYTDWRLPNIKELSSIVERQCETPAINLEVFPATPSERFWSSSPVAAINDDAWLVNFEFGISSSDYRIEPFAISGDPFIYAVRLVRNGQ